jgi:Type II secretory pathway, component PulM
MSPREQLLQQLEPLRERAAELQTRYQALAPREQRLLALGGAVAALALLYYALWHPVGAWRQNATDSQQQARDLAVQIAELAPLAERAQRDRTAGGAQGSLLSVVDQATRNGKLPKPPARMQPDGEKRVRLWFDGVPFEAVLQWLDQLDRSDHVRVASAQFERKSKPGEVDLRLALVRGS